MANACKIEKVAGEPSAGGERMEMLKIPLDLLFEEPGFNERDYVDPDVAAQIEAFANAFAAREFLPPLLVRFEHGSEKFYVVDGHQRRRGALLARERGIPVKDLNCIVFTGSKVDRFVVQCKSAQGLQLKPVGIARNYLKLQRLGLSVQEIAVAMGKVPLHVENMLVLATANADVQAMVNSGAVAATTAIEAVKAYGDNAGGVLASKLQDAMSLGKTKVKPSAIREWFPPRKAIGGIYASLNSMVRNLDAKKRRQLAELEKLSPEQLQGRTIEMDASAVLALYKSWVAAEDVRLARENDRHVELQKRRQQQLPGTD